jgi:hypothetical protein
MPGATYKADAHSGTKEAHIEQRNTPVRHFRPILTLTVHNNSALHICHRIRVHKPAAGDIDKHIALKISRKY